MYTVSIISNPDFTRLDEQIILRVSKAFGKINDFKWLMSKVALEFEIPKYPKNIEEIWAELQNLEIDLAIQKSIGRKKRVLVADMDSTIIHQECIDELASEYGVGQAVSEITKRSMNGEISFENSLRERVKLLKGMKIDIIDKVLKEKITYRAGAEVLINTMKNNGCYTAIVSGGFTAFSKVISDTLGFNESIANKLLKSDGIFTGFVQEPILGESSKVHALRAISKKLGVDFQDFIAVGDGANDIGMLDLAGLGVALHAKKIVQEVTNIKINFGDLTSLLFLQGYTESEFCW
jgi:phosphoserine phosphatase